jgi:hypothetical protein
MPRLFVIPSWALIVACFALGFAATKWVDAERRATFNARSLVSCEARAQMSLVAATKCDSLLTTCMGSVRIIADELQLERVEF